jgi:hypothetical protein
MREQGDGGIGAGSGVGGVVGGGGSGGSSILLKPVDDSSARWNGMRNKFDEWLAEQAGLS